MAEAHGRHYSEDEPFEPEDESVERSHFGGGPSSPFTPISDVSPLEAPATPDERIGPLPDIRADDIAGPFDGWLGQVRNVHTVGTYAETGYGQEIYVSRVGVHFQTNNEPQAYDVPTAWSQATPQGIAALPWPVRHDQAEHLVSVDDIVTVITGRDGRAYYMVDDAPFLARVMSHVDTDYITLARQNDPPASPNPTDVYIVGTAPTGAWAGHGNAVATWSGAAWTFATPANPSYAYNHGTDTFLKFTTSWASTSDVTEANCGGAGLTTLRVIRKALAGAPGGTSVSGFSDLQNAASAYIEYEHVMVAAPPGVHHGYRVGDDVMVHRRGNYLFANPLARQFLAKTVATGPAAEADFATNHYWVQEWNWVADYTTNQWVFGGGSTYRTATDPTGSGGRYGRYVDAMNIAEGAAEHNLPAASMVLVTCLADNDTGEVFYIFDSWRPSQHMIMMYHGAVEEIPDGWHLCNGDPGGSTLDLSGLFVACAGSTYSVGATGGYDWHGQTENNHNDHDLSHKHAGSCTSVDQNPTPGDYHSNELVWDWSAGSTEYTFGPTWNGTDNLPTQEKPSAYNMAAHKGPYNTNADTDNRPRFYALAFIERL